jgi:lipopolysaccharide assembly protein A
MMSVLKPDHGESQVPPAAVPQGKTAEPGEPAEPTGSTGPPVEPGSRAVPRTRWGAAWVGICAAALALVALIVFMLQNTRPVEVSFLWLHGTLPLALALLIAGVGSVIVAMVFGVARITQLRKLARHRHE